MNKTLALALAIAGHLAYMVVVPLLVLGGLGLWADRSFDTLPRYLFVGIVLAFVTTIYWLSQRLAAITKQLTSKD